MARMVFEDVVAGSGGVEWDAYLRRSWLGRSGGQTVCTASSPKGGFGGSIFTNCGSKGSFELIRAAQRARILREKWLGPIKSKSLFAKAPLFHAARRARINDCGYVDEGFVSGAPRKRTHMMKCSIQHLVRGPRGSGSGTSMLTSLICRLRGRRY